jgi:hypothetical protein
MAAGCWAVPSDLPVVLRSRLRLGNTLNFLDLGDSILPGLGGVLVEDPALSDAGVVPRQTWVGEVRRHAGKQVPSRVEGLTRDGPAR